ncbi:MAG: hypothetical protein QGG05_14615, partial [Candidatus Latescibacteria bacterium]|nr:hypothetical protein [Candidatus Latescibacterota bacterium]
QAVSKRYGIPVLIAHQGSSLGTEVSSRKRCPIAAAPSSPANAKLLAKGLNPDDGGAEIVCFGVPGGGHVFSVGSISWPAALPVDEHVSQITRNVLQRFLD